MNILCIDDEPEIIYVLTQYLTMVGHTVKSALNGEDGLREITARQTPLDLIITDVRMPEMTGLDLLKKIRGLGVVTPVVFISGHQDNEIAEAINDYGVLAVLAKPFSLEDVDRILAMASL